MEWWQPIVLGAGIALISRPLSTAAIEAFKQPHQRDERRRAAQRDSLVVRLDHLDGVEVADVHATINVQFGGWTRPWPADLGCVARSADRRGRLRVLPDHRGVSAERRSAGSHPAVIERCAGRTAKNA